MRLPSVAVLALLSALRVAAETLPASMEVTIEPEKFGEVSSILKVNSLVGSFRLDQPAQHLALVLESRPKEPRTVHVARLSLELTKPVKEGRFCVQMVDQGFLPLGNGSPNQMQLLMQLDCGGTVISSSQSFLKEKFNMSKSRARTGAGTLTRKIVGSRAPIFWMMGNSDSSIYFNDDDLEKMIDKNKDAYVLIAYLQVAKEPPPPPNTSPLAEAPEQPTKPPSPAIAAADFVGPPAPVPNKEEVKPAVVDSSTKPKTSTSPSSKGGKSKSSKSSPKKKKKSS